MQRVNRNAMVAKFCLATVFCVLGFFATRWVHAGFGRSHAPVARIARVQEGWQAVNGSDGSYAVQLPKGWSFVDYTSSSLPTIRGEEVKALRQKQATPGYAEAEIAYGQKLYALDLAARRDDGPLVNVVASAIPDGMTWDKLEGNEAGRATLFHSQILAAYPFQRGFLIESVPRLLPEHPAHEWTYYAPQGKGFVQLTVSTQEPPTPELRRMAETILSTAQFRE